MLERNLAIAGWKLYLSPQGDIACYWMVHMSMTCWYIKDKAYVI